MNIYKFIKTKENIMKAVFLISAILSILSLGVIVIYLLGTGVPVIAQTGFVKFIFGLEWSILNEVYGVFAMIVASIYLTVLATIIGVPLGLLTSIALYKFVPKKVVPILRQIINLLAGIPSVLIGLFGIIVVVPFVANYIAPGGAGGGYGLLSAGIVLAIMTLPTIVSVSYDALESVPQSYYEASLALGATKEQATFKVLLPSAKSGIMASVVLAIGRAIGETMAVIMVIGGSVELPTSLFQSVRTLTANIALGAGELSGDSLNALIATGVVLLVLTLAINMGFMAIKNYDKNSKKTSKKQKVKVAKALQEDMQQEKIKN